MAAHNASHGIVDGEFATREAVLQAVLKRSGGRMAAMLTIGT